MSGGRNKPNHPRTEGETTSVNFYPSDINALPTGLQPGAIDQLHYTTAAPLHSTGAFVIPTGTTASSYNPIGANTSPSAGVATITSDYELSGGRPRPVHPKTNEQSTSGPETGMT